MEKVNSSKVNIFLDLVVEHRYKNPEKAKKYILDALKIAHNDPW